MNSLAEVSVSSHHNKLQTKMKELAKKLLNAQEQIAEQRTEIKIIKREKDEIYAEKLEMQQQLRALQVTKTGSQESS